MTSEESAAGAAAIVDYGSVRPDGAIAPDLETFRRAAAQQRVVPVIRRLLADGHTPVGMYRALAAERPGTFLLESAEQGRAWTRYSFVGVSSAAMLTEDAGSTRWAGRVPAAAGRDANPVLALRDTVSALHTERQPGLPPLTGGMVGALSYDAVRRWERVSDANPDELGVPELAMLLATDLAVLDHHDGTVTLIANALNYDDLDSGVDAAHADAVERLDRMAAALAAPVQAEPVAVDPDREVWFNRRTDPDDYFAAVEVAKEHIFAGDAFQIVLSQRFERPTQASALDIYRMLRTLNPSPYMYLFRFPGAHGAGLGAPAGSEADAHEDGFDVIGSSPEALVTVQSGLATLHPIAGTRPRGETPEQDAELAEELLADAKECAEHLMLVDLGRNDLGRVSAPGSVNVVEFMKVERFSHVMHIVSTVTGQLAPGVSAYDALAATFPAGTLSGAPKPSAMEIIDRLEPSRRGIYAGAVGYLDFAGDADLAIAIRTALLKDGVAYVQAGGGIVADSDPVMEEAECRHKAGAVLRAISLAESMRGIDEPASDASAAGQRDARPANAPTSAAGS